VVSAPLGVSDELSALVRTRYREALHGDLRMNCDVCLYRVAMPGRSDAVGAPQAPHAHPDDEPPPPT
jgi:sirohydrochlorin cobaltochelatase